MGRSPVTPFCPEVRDVDSWYTFEYKMAYMRMYLFVVYKISFRKPEGRCTRETATCILG